MEEIAGTGRSVLFVDDDDDLRESMVEVLTDVFGVPCVAARSHAEVAENGDRVHECPLAIIDINLGAGEPSGFEVSAWLRANGFRGRIVFLTGHGRSGAAVQPTDRDAPVLGKPVHLDELRALVREAFA